MTQTDLKEPRPDSTPHSQAPSGPPPYDPAESDGLPARPWNNILISRTFGALKDKRFTVDPNLHLPPSLVQPERRIVAFPRPKPNLELAVDFGAIDAKVEVLPLNENERVDSGDAEGSWSRFDVDEASRDKVLLKASTTTGNITLRLHAPATTPIALRAESTFGQVCIFLPRTLHGPLAISTSLRTARLSPELRRVCAPLSESGGTRRWFVGDLGAWSTRGDDVRLGSQFGLVWVGYVGEEKDAERVLRQDPVRVFWEMMKGLMLFGAGFVLLKLLFRLLEVLLGWL
ncbi:hypothetical protein FB451DRAFT_1126382 [Mycena latifolia]|nr:hypothetical protein FB451DRAFT_1126382 [Mycena latifolia]